MATLSNITSLGELMVGHPDLSHTPKLTLKPQAGQTAFTHNYGVTMNAGSSGYLDVQFQQFTTEGSHTQYTGIFKGSVTGANAIYQVEGATTWQGGTILGSSDTNYTEWFIARGSLNIAPTLTTSYLQYRTLKNLANAAWSSGGIQLTNAIIMNGDAADYANAKWYVDQDYDITRASSADTTSRFDNYGLFQKKTGTAGSDTKVDAAFNNQSTGAVEVKQSELWLSEGGTGSGPYSVDASAKLSLSYNHTLSGEISGGGQVAFRNDGSQVGTFNVTGPYNIAPAGSSTTAAGGSTVTMNNVTSLGDLAVQDTAKLTLNPKTGQASLTHPYAVTLSSSQFLEVTIPTFLVTGNYLQSNGTLKGTAASGDTLFEVQGVATWTGGTILGTTAGGTETFRTAGTLNIQGPAGSTLYLTDRTLETQPGSLETSKVTWTDGTLRLSVAPIVNAAGVTWDVRTDADIVRATPASDATSRFDNYGTVQKSLSTAPGYTIFGLKFTNFGGAQLHVQQGKLTLTELINEALGVVTIDSTTTLAVDGAVTNRGMIEQTRDMGTGHFVRILNDAGNTADPKYLGVEITSGDLGSGTHVAVWGNQDCGMALGSDTTQLDPMVLRCFEIDPATVASADITFHYLDSEATLNNNPDGWHYAPTPDPRWTIETRITQNNSGPMRWVATTDVDEYSPFGLANAGALAVTLAEFSAAQVDDHILVTWQTVSELDTSGYHLQRGTSEAGPDTQLNATLIPSQSPGSTAGFSYTWEDRRDLAPGTIYYYWLDDVDFAGTVTRHGPVSAVYQGPTAVALGELQAGSEPGPGVAWWWVAAVGLGLAAAAWLKRARAQPVGRS